MAIACLIRVVCLCTSTIFSEEFSIRRRFFSLSLSIPRSMLLNASRVIGSHLDGVSDNGKTACRTIPSADGNVEFMYFICNVICIVSF